MENIIITDKQTLQELVYNAVEQALETKIETIIEQIKADEIYTTAEVAELLKVSDSTITKWRKKGKINYRQQGATVRYSRKDVQNCLKGMAIE